MGSHAMPMLCFNMQAHLPYMCTSICMPPHLQCIPINMVIHVALTFNYFLLVFASKV